jgi:hypothetical protein
MQKALATGQYKQKYCSENALLAHNTALVYLSTRPVTDVMIISNS